MAVTVILTVVVTVPVIGGVTEVLGLVGKSGLLQMTVEGSIYLVHRHDHRHRHGHRHGHRYRYRDIFFQYLPVLLLLILPGDRPGEGLREGGSYVMCHTLRDVSGYNERLLGRNGIYMMN